MKIKITSNGRLGDILAMTTGVRDLKKQYPEYLIKPQTTNMDVWKNNPNTANYEGEPDMVIDSLLGEVTQRSKTNGLHITQGARLRFEEKLNIKIIQGKCIPDLYLTQEEKEHRIIKQKYSIINTEYGNVASETKRWNDNKWQEIVNKLPWIMFVQTGTNRHCVKVKGDNVIDMIGKTDNLRELFSLFYHSENIIALIGGNAHLAAAFKKPAVVIAGSNEPVTFEKYPFHRYLHNIGALKCSGDNGCWKCRLSGCKEIVNGVPKCKDMISSDDVVREIKSYYEGGACAYPVKAVNIGLGKKKILKLLTNCHSWGGAERSSTEIMKMAYERGYEVQYLGKRKPCKQFSETVPFAKYTTDLTGNCDVFVFYASDMVFSLDKPEFDVFKNIRAKRKIMALTYRIGKTPNISWARGWDKYIFLCSDLRDKFLEKYHTRNTVILAPPVDLEPFLKIERDYDKPITLLRYSSQGDVKYNKNINEIIENTKCNYKFMPAPSFIAKSDKIIAYNYNEMKVEAFLKEGNCGWYSLPDKYIDNGARVNVEMLASGLPVLGNPWGGCKDRLNEKIGWFCNTTQDFINLINSLTIEEIKNKGITARNYAVENFKKEKWIDIIIGEK